jgi:hypothetical protein
MKKLISNIIYSILAGEDYRTYVLATINKRFIDKVQELVAEIFQYKRMGNNWFQKLLHDTYRKNGKENKFKLLWYGGLNDKTVKNMTGGTSTKEVCLDIGKKNIDALRLLLSEVENSEKLYQIKIIIKKDTEQVELDEIESIIFVNIISAMKLTIQGGAWSEVGKQTEKSLLFTIFQSLKISKDDYVLIIEFRQENPLMKIYKFFISKNVNCSPPEEMTSEQLKEKIKQIIETWEESKEELRIIKTLKELTK